MWPMPITLDVTPEEAERIKAGDGSVALRDPEGLLIAVLEVEDVWEPDLQRESQALACARPPVVWPVVQ